MATVYIHSSLCKPVEGSHKDVTILSGYTFVQLHVSADYDKKPKTERYLTTGIKYLKMHIG